MLNITSLKNLETTNFKLVQDNGKPAIKATTPMAKSYLRLKGFKNPMPVTFELADEVIAQLVSLEASVAKLAAI